MTVPITEIVMPHWAEPLRLTVIVCFVSLCVILQWDFLCNCWKLSIYKWETHTKCHSLKAQMTSFLIKGLVIQLRHGLLTLKAIVRVRPFLGFQNLSKTNLLTADCLPTRQFHLYHKKWQFLLKSWKQLSMWARLHHLLQVYCLISERSQAIKGIHVDGGHGLEI